MSEFSLVLPTIADGEDKSCPLTNSLRNHYRHLRKWAKRTGTDAFRLYDRQAPMFPVAIDYYAGRFCVHYFSPSSLEQDPSAGLQKAVTDAIYKVFGMGEEAIFWRTRSRSKETRQYEKRGDSKEFFTAYEYGVKFWINLVDYLDTGLFLDHRETRAIVAKEAKDKRLLNLFSYTGAFSVQAAAHGASFTKSVDMSNTYSDWCRDNFILNKLPLQNNEIVRADCLKFLPDEIRARHKYDLIVIDPPTISRSKKMESLFDIQVDYTHLIHSSLKLLSPNGTMYFSTNHRKFIFDTSLFPQCRVHDITNKTLPIDFKDSKLHRCWKIQCE